MYRRIPVRGFSTALAALIGIVLTLWMLLISTPASDNALAAPYPYYDQPVSRLDAAAGITIVKTAPSVVYQALGAGETLVQYDLTIQNPAGYTIDAGAIVTDALPAGTVLDSGNTGPGWAGTFVAGGTRVTYTLLSSTDSTTIDVGSYDASVPVPVRDGSTVVNAGYCFSGTVNGVPGAFCEGEPVTTVIRAPDFSLVESPSAPVCAGGHVTYTLSVTNPGGVQTTQPFTIVGQIAPTLNVLSDTISAGGVWTPTTITWNVTSTVLQADGANQVRRTFVATVPLTVAHGTPVTNTYVVTSPEVSPNVLLWRSSYVSVTHVGAAFTSSASLSQSYRVAFQNHSVGATEYRWDFGDGSPISTETHPVHLYTDVGTYTVALTATGACGFDTVTDTVTVLTGCVGASVTSLASDEPVDQGQTMHFTATATGDAPITYTWDFGDGTPTLSGTDLLTTSHVYATAGRFTVTLTVHNACGADTDTLAVTVNCVPLSGPDFVWEPASPTTTQTVSFTGTVTAGGPPMNYHWGWGDGTPPGTGNPAYHTFVLSGTYPVVMTVTNACSRVTATHVLTATGAPFTPTYGVELAPPSASRDGAAGQTVVHTLNLTNTGDVADSFYVEWEWAVAGEQWATTVTPTRTDTLPPGGATAVQVSVLIPTTAISDQHSVVTVAATSVVSTGVSDRSTLTTTAIGEADFSSSYKTGPASGNRDDVIYYTIVAVNSGAPVQDVVLSDVLPYTVLFVPGSCTYRREAGPAQPCGPLSHMWQEDFDTGDRITTTFAVQLTAGSMNWPVVNCAYLSWDEQQEKMCFTTVINRLRHTTYLPIVMRNYTYQPPPSPSLTLIADPTTLPVGESSVLTATVRDGYGIAVTGMTVTFSTADPLGSGALTPSGSTTDEGGQITATLTSTVEGTVRVVAEADNGASDFVDVFFGASGFCAPELVSEVNTGPRSRGVAIDTAGRRAFVAHANGVTVIDTGSNAVIAETQSPPGAYAVAYDPDRDRIWVTRRDADRVVVLDGTTYDTLADLATGDEPRSVAYNPANDRVYVVNFGGDSVVVYDAAGMRYERTLNDFRDPTQLAVNPVTNKIYVINHVNNGQMTVIRGDTHETYRLATGLLDGFGVAVDTTRNLIYATSVLEGRLVIIDGETEEGLGKVEFRYNDGQKAPLRSIVVNPDVGSEGHLLLISSSQDGGRDQLLLVPNGWPTLGTPVPLDLASYPLEGMAFDPLTERVWVTSVESGLVSVIQDGLPVCSTPFLLSTRAQE